MKTCPYCAEEIQDAAIKCRFCQSWLVDEVPAGAGTPPKDVVLEEAKPAEPPSMITPATVPPSAVAPATVPATVPSVIPTAVVSASEPPTSEPPTSEQKVEFTHSGERFLLGYTDDSFGIWDRQSPAAPSERFPRTDDGWRQVWQRYAAIEASWMDLRTGQRSP